MPEEPNRPTFSLRELLVVIGIIGVLLALTVPFIQRAREAARRTECGRNLMMLGMGLTMHHEAHGRFPAVSNQSNPGGEANVGIMPGSGTLGTNAGFLARPGTASGYSWIVKIIPYLHSSALFQQVTTTTQGFTQDGWSNTPAYQVMVDGVPQHFSTVPLDDVACPSYGGNMISTACSGASGIPASVTAYSLPATGYATFKGSAASRPFGVAITNYVALAATTSLNMPGADTADGGLIPGAGTTRRSFLDGIYTTLIVCETKEPAFNSWYDGTTAWTTATPAGTKLSVDANGLLAVPPGGVTALGYGPWPIQSSGAACLYAPSGYTTAGFTGQSGSIAWGPSSDHAGGIVVHLAADGAVHAIKADIDPTLYVQLVTRQGREPATVPGTD